MRRHRAGQLYLWLTYRMMDPAVGSGDVGHVDELGGRGRAVAAGGRPGSHEVWRHVSGRKVTVPRHAGDMAEGTLRAILREVDIDVSDFLAPE